LTGSVLNELNTSVTGSPDDGRIFQRQKGSILVVEIAASVGDGTCRVCENLYPGAPVIGIGRIGNIPAGITGSSITDESNQCLSAVYNDLRGNIIS